MSNKTDNAADVRRFTPGPWEVGDRAYFGAMDNGNWLVIHADNRLRNVGAAVGTFLHADPNHPLNIEQEANARLMSASPDLLAACEEAKTVLVREGYFGGVVDQLRAAIARAKGGQ